MKKIYTSLTIKKLALAITVFSFSGLLAQTTYTFTNASATGSAGPTQGQLNTAYASTNLNGQVTTTNGIQSWTVPSTGAYNIKALGAQGGNVGGLGAEISGNFTLTAGTVLKILVGQEGQFISSSSNNGGGGGGGSFVTLNNNTPLLIAGGGGGQSSQFYTSMPYDPIISGGQSSQTGGSTASNGGGINGNGANAGVTDCCLPGNLGASGGGGLLTTGTVGATGGPGQAFVLGGVGGAGNPLGIGGFGGGSGCAYDNAVRSGGGGGYSGGQGGIFTATNSTSYCHGGGGASYNSGVNQTNISNVNPGHGKILIASLFSISLAQTATIACNSLSTAALSATVNGGAPPFTYTWSPSGGNAATASNLAAGVYTLTVTDSNTLTSSESFTITEPTALTSSLTGQTNLTCFGDANGSATVSVNGGTAPYTYTWSPSGGNTLTASSLSGGVYVCNMNDNNGCVTSVNVNITQPAAIGGSASSTIICKGNSVTLSGNGATSYTWSGGVTNGSPFSPSVTTTYTVSGTNTLTGCTGSAVVNITVSECTSINKNTGEAVFVKMYPNPNNGLFTIDAGTSKLSTIMVLDLSGKLILTEEVNSNKAQIDLRNLANGVYQIKAETTEGMKLIKLIKE